MTPRINYIELGATDLAASSKFYNDAFGWTLADYGLSYAATTTGDVDIGLQADVADAPPAPLPVILVDDLYATLAAVKSAGGIITLDPFDFPGGRRFHFTDPSGNALAAWVMVG